MLFYFLSVQICCHSYLYSAEVRKKPYNHVTRIINNIMDVSSYKNFSNLNSTGTLSAMIGYENDWKRMKECSSCYGDGEWWRSGPGTSTTPWDVTECFPAWLVCFCTLSWLNRCERHPGFRLMMPTVSHTKTEQEIQHLTWSLSVVYCTIFMLSSENSNHRKGKHTPFPFLTLGICNILSKRYWVMKCCT